MARLTKHLTQRHSHVTKGDIILVPFGVCASTTVLLCDGECTVSIGVFVSGNKDDKVDLYYEKLKKGGATLEENDKKSIVKRFPFFKPDIAEILGLVQFTLPHNYVRIEKAKVGTTIVISYYYPQV